MGRVKTLVETLTAGFWGCDDDVKKWYWSGHLSPKEREWPNDFPLPEVEPTPKWAIRSAVLAVALIVAYAAYVFLMT
jgi:hypothetical protein